MSGKSFHIGSLQWALDLGVSHHMTSKFGVLTMCINCQYQLLFYNLMVYTLKLNKLVRFNLDLKFGAERCVVHSNILMQPCFPSKNSTR